MGGCRERVRAGADNPRTRLSLSLLPRQVKEDTVYDQKPQRRGRKLSDYEKWEIKQLIHSGGCGERAARECTPPACQRAFDLHDAAGAHTRPGCCLCRTHVRL